MQRNPSSQPTPRLKSLSLALAKQSVLLFEIITIHSFRRKQTTHTATLVHTRYTEIAYMLAISPQSLIFQFVH